MKKPDLQSNYFHHPINNNLSEDKNFLFIPSMHISMVILHDDLLHVLHHITQGSGSKRIFRRLEITY